MPTDDIPHKLVRLLLELIASGELPELAVGGAWQHVSHLVTPRPALGPVALEADICGVAAAGLRTVGPAADWVVSTLSSLALVLARCVASAEMTGLACCVRRASHAATQARHTLQSRLLSGLRHSMANHSGQTWRRSSHRGCSTSAPALSPRSQPEGWRGCTTRITLRSFIRYACCETVAVSPAARQRYGGWLQRWHSASSMI